MDVASFDRYLAARAAEGLFSGVIRIERAGEPLLAAAYGMASRAWGIPCSLDHRFDTASITKLFTAVATLQQVEAGAFGLETGVDRLPRALGDDDLAGGHAVPPAHAHLRHRRRRRRGGGEKYADVFIDRPNYAVRETRDLLEQFVHKPPNFAPGRRRRYCNVGYVLLGLMVERASGLTYRDYVAERVFAPAGMARSGFFQMDVVEPDVAEGADPIRGSDGAITGWRRNIYSYPPIGSPDGGAHVTADDLLRFHRALRRGELLGAELTAAMLSPKEMYRVVERGAHYTGFGFEFELGRDGALRSYWKEGSNPGVSCILSHYAQTDTTVALLSNIEDAAWEPVKRLDDELMS